MKFKIFSKRDDGKNVLHFYDNITQEILTEKNIPVYLINDPRCKRLTRHSTHRYQLEDSKTVQSHIKKLEINNLRITLGFDCNFSCKYCLEAQTRHKHNKFHHNRGSLDDRVENLIAMLKKSDIKPRSITFWGGEPFVYIKAIQKLTPKLKELYPEAGISTITNGSLLTPKLCEWLVENDIGLTVSHDGPSFNAYRNDKNPLDDDVILQSMKYYVEQASKPDSKLRFGFNCVITPENSDLSQLAPYFESYFGRPVHFGFESIAKLNAFSKDVITPFDEQHQKLLLNHIVAYGSTESNDHPYGSMRDRVTNVLKDLINRTNMYTVPTSCMVGAEDFLAIDMQGNLLKCHGAAETYGTLSELNEATFEIEHPWTTRDNCRTCPYLVSCKGGCVMASNEDTNATCKNLQIWHAGLFIAAWKILFDSTIYKIEPMEE